MLRDNFRLFLRPNSAERAVFEAWPSQRPKAAPHEITHDLSWEIPAVFRSDFHGHHIGRILTLTGQEGNAYASPCDEYLRDTWPEMGPLLLNAVEEFLIERDESKSLLFDYVVYDMKLTDGWFIICPKSFNWGQYPNSGPR
jgi:hypothetical protein